MSKEQKFEAVSKSGKYTLWADENRRYFMWRKEVAGQVKISRYYKSEESANLAMRNWEIEWKQAIA